MNTFICKHRKKSWVGCISSFKAYGTHYEFSIQSRSSITIVFGRTSQGYFACMPDFDAGCHLANLNDVFGNMERLTAVLGVINGITVAYALLHLWRELGYPEFWFCTSDDLLFICRFLGRIMHSELYFAVFILWIF
jgi:hypothetical protein